MEDSDAEASLLMTLNGDAPKNQEGIGIERNRRIGEEDGIMKNIIWLETC